MGNGFGHEINSPLVSVEWYTPQYIFDALGVIYFDLDPCSARDGDFVPAIKKIKPPEDGLSAEWVGKVWLNPPYGNKTGVWLEKLAQHGNGIALVFARTDTRWFQKIIKKSSGICFISPRVKFIDSKTMQQSKNSGGTGSCLIAFGEENLEILKRSNLGAVFTYDN